MTTVSSDMSIDPRHYVKMFWRRKGVILLSVITVFCSALVALSFMPDEYEATVQVSFEEAQTAVPEITPQTSSGPREDARLQRFASVIQSRPFLTLVVLKLPNMTSTPSVRAVAEEIQRKTPQLSVDEIALRLVVDKVQSRLRFVSRGSGIYEVVVTDSDPATAKDLAGYIGDLYMEETKKHRVEGLQYAILWSEEQGGLHEQELRVAEEKYEQYRESQIQKELPPGAVRAENRERADLLQRGVRKFAEAAEDLVRERTNDLDKAEINKATADAILSDTEFNQHAEQLKEDLTGGVDNRLTLESLPEGESLWPPPEYRVLRQRLAAKLQERVQIKRPRANPVNVATYVDYLLSRIDAHARSEVAKDLDQRIEAYEQQAQNQPEQELALQKLKQDVDSKRATRELFRNSETKNTILQQAESASLGGQVRILEPPQLPLAPSRPNRVKILLGALLLGTMFGLGLAFLSEIMDPTVRTLADIQRVAPEPVLCTTPLLSKLQPRVQGIRRFWLPAAVSAVVLLTAAFFAARLIAQEEPLPGAHPAGEASDAQTGR